MARSAKQVAPQVTRIAFIYNPDNPGAKITLQSAKAGAGQFSFELLDVPVRDIAGIEVGIARLARESGGALLVPPDPFSTGYRKRVVELALRDRLPLVAAVRSFADEGGLLAYGVNIPDLFRQAAGYVGRILRGEKPADLPITQPTKFELVINLKTAKALGLTIPETLLATADEVIQ
jgi:putative tryptophan/tyrosine transport system substrate-binding protein